MRPQPYCIELGCWSHVSPYGCVTEKQELVRGKERGNNAEREQEKQQPFWALVTLEAPVKVEPAVSKGVLGGALQMLRLDKELCLTATISAYELLCSSCTGCLCGDNIVKIAAVKLNDPGEGYAPNI